MTPGYDLREDDRNFLLKVPFEDRERAKGVAGRRWDPLGKVWLYPKSRQMFDALMGEFGEELKGADVPRPQEGEAAASPAVVASLQRSIESLESQVRLLERPPHGGRDADAVVSEVAELREHLKASDAMGAKLRDNFIEVDRRRIQAENALALAREELTQERYKRKRDADELVRLRSSSREAKAPKPPGTLIEELHNVLLEGSPKSTDLLLPLRMHGLTKVGTAEVGAQFEKLLRARLGVAGSVTFYELIVQCFDAEILTIEGRHLATQIRIQRNNAVHDLVSSKTYPIRALLTAACAALTATEL